MSAHLAVEHLSAYLDAELAEAARRDAETHLESCVSCRRELARLREVAAGLGALERLAPPPVLAATVEQQVARAAVRRRRPGLGSRLAPWAPQPVVGVSFALVVAFAVIVFLFAEAVEQRGRATIPVRFAAEPVATAERVPAAGEQRGVAGLTFVWSDGAWREEAALGQPVAAAVGASDEAGLHLLAARPGVADLVGQGHPVALLVDGEVVVVHPVAGETASGEP